MFLEYRCEAFDLPTFQRERMNNLNAFPICLLQFFYPSYIWHCDTLKTVCWWAMSRSFSSLSSHMSLQHISKSFRFHNCTDHNYILMTVFCLVWAFEPYFSEIVTLEMFADTSFRPIYASQYLLRFRSYTIIFSYKVIITMKELATVLKDSH